MRVTYHDPGFPYSIHSILMFQTEAQSNWWREAIFLEYPRLNRAHFESLDSCGQTEYLQDTLCAVYNAEKPALPAKVERYNEHFLLHQRSVEDAFSDAFGIDCHSHYQDITGNITLNPICPRFLDTRTFDVFYQNSERGALGVALHELIHFVWFDVWQSHFGDNACEYEEPHIKWVFSEMVVDPIMRADERLSSINPYFKGGCAYDYFYTMQIEGKQILETLFEMYRQKKDIQSFMEQGFAYCRTHETAIRQQMF